ncbi:non-canonical purine NTP pyrophosphatase [Paenibacillus sp. UNC451MF]|uniref:non-canonical purine NTP pyrophosphatase n=1 Tax=Paenibacillus sp. UNC451MF TaxID=1449063 RepID=UPI00048FFB6F|nr:non-canonical purine NTP pyrophosphatase [Paenibacillus sp. UNC451MF]
MELIYVTSNAAKFEIATKVLRGTNITLKQSNIDVPEIQSMKVEDIAQFSCKWARDKLGSSVVVTDVGLYINALNGFPDPFVKYINNCLTAEDVIKLLEDKEDRTVYTKECLAFCEMDSEPVIFQRHIKGTTTTNITSKNGSVMDQLVIPENDILLAHIPNNEVIDFWVKHSAFNHFKEWIPSL